MSSLSASYTPLPVTAQETRDWLPEFLASQDQPLIDGYNTWCVARLARAQGIKVALSGLGGDELFGGYPSVRQVPRLHRWRLSVLGPVTTTLRQLPNGHQGRRQRLADWLQLPPSAPPPIVAFEACSPPQKSPACYCTGAWLECSTYLLNQLSPDSDVMAMAGGLELHLLLVDASLQHQLCLLPAALRLAPGKELLAKAVPELPSWFLNRPKQGFHFPFQLWLDDPASPLPLRLPSTPPALICAPGIAAGH